MALGKMSRAQFVRGLARNAWSVLFYREEPVGCEVYEYSHVHVHVEANSQNVSATRIKVQESANAAGPWIDRYVHPVNLEAGGSIDFDTYHVQRYMRVVAFNTNGGELSLQVQVPEDQALPSLLDNVALDCASFCEVDCETGAETTDEMA
jgi:hypothetical protein